jgi:hypothetical protein
MQRQLSRKDCIGPSPLMPGPLWIASEFRTISENFVQQNHCQPRLKRRETARNKGGMTPTMVHTLVPPWFQRVGMLLRIEGQSSCQGPGRPGCTPPMSPGDRTSSQRGLFLSFHMEGNFPCLISDLFGNHDPCFLCHFSLWEGESTFYTCLTTVF